MRARTACAAFSELSRALRHLHADSPGFPSPSPPHIGTMCGQYANEFVCLGVDSAHTGSYKQIGLSVLESVSTHRVVAEGFIKYSKTNLIKIQFEPLETNTYLI